MFSLIMVFAILAGQFAEGLFACFCLLVACVMIDILAFFLWSTFLVSFVSSMF
jgi:hypothetical protein